ncbi:MAG: hypothetical protein O2968_11125 [Acidobacteria bacterium]|nr:hypothetical protein [Acidobacteriota bacterium]
MVACLALVAGVLPCPLMLANLVPGAHDCCEKPDQHSDEDSTGCKTRCAQAAERAALQDGLRSPDLQSFESVPAAAGLATPVQDYPARAPLRLAHAYPQPSLYILNASFLI